MSEEEKPLTREDVLKMIEEHGGPEGLDLSGRNLSGGDFHGLDLHGIILNGADLSVANLQEADMRRAQLHQARLFGAELQKASLWAGKLQEADLSAAKMQQTWLFGANLRGANLLGASLQKAELYGADLEDANLWAADLEGASLDGVDWGAHYVLRQEKEGSFGAAKLLYRRLKNWHTQAGMYDIAGEFYFREMTARRKAAGWHLQDARTLWQVARERGVKPPLRALFHCRPLLWLWYMALSVLCGYGERPQRVVLSAAAVVLGLALFYWWLGTFDPPGFGRALYYSAASFTALGYGRWAPQPTGWAQGMGAAEALIGVFMIALFLVTFTRKMVR